MPGNQPGPTGTNSHHIKNGTLARNATQSTIVMRLVETAPGKALSIKQFIQLVEKEEKRYSTEEQQNTKLMITRLRKIFYGKDSWDKYLIERAKKVKRPYITKSVISARVNLPVDWAPDMEVVRKQYLVSDPLTGKTPLIAKNQEIRLTNGSYIDIAHVFAGLDAINFPQMVDGPFKVNIDKNVDATTWVGDLGSVLAELKIKELQKHKGKLGPLTTAEANAIIHEYASPQDLLGNIDAYVIKTKYDISKASQGMKVSEILRRYYLTDSAYIREHRYSIFATQIGLTGWNGSVFSNESDWVRYYSDQVNDAATLYLGANTEGISKYPMAIGMSGNKGATMLVKRFLTSLKSRIVLEP